MNKHPIQDPKPISPEPKDPEINPTPEGPSSSNPVTASNQADEKQDREPLPGPVKT